MRTPEEERMIKDKDYDHVGTQLDIDNWAGALMIGGFMLFVLGVMLFVGKCLAYFIEYLL